MNLFISGMAHDSSPTIQGIVTGTEDGNNRQAKASDLSSHTKTWNLDNLNGIFSSHIINVIRNVPVPVMNI